MMEHIVKFIYIPIEKFSNSVEQRLLLDNGFRLNSFSRRIFQALIISFALF